ncbi:B12-binding domain-containing radical SAM protein, partial [Patescibacteria group bacterium]
MKILLINPSFDYYSKYLLTGEPLSLAYLAANLKKNGYEVNILDAVAGDIKKNGSKWRYGLSKIEIINKIKEFNPDVVGITCSFSLRNYFAVEMAKLVKRINSKIITVIGGVHPTIFPLETIRIEEIDYIIAGEGEESFLSLVRYLESANKTFKLFIDGCAYKNGDELKFIPKKNFIENLDLLSFPARELLPMEFYIKKPTVLYGLGMRRSASIITSRSCPNRCSFCSMYLSHGPKWRSRSAENVFEEIKLLVEKYRVEEIFFMDDNLTFNKERVMILCDMILRHRIKFRWNTPNGVAANSLDFDLASIMKKAGCANICIGVESGNDYIRNSVIKKGLARQTINKALNACNRAKLPVVGFFILGIPGENEYAFKDTLNMVKKFPFDMITTSFFTPFPGTKLYDDCVKDGYIAKDYWERIKQFNAPVVETSDFNIKTLREREKKIYYEFFKSNFLSLIYSIIT